MLRIQPAALASLALVAGLLLNEPETAEACTTFCLKQSDEVVVGKSYDWHLGDGLLIFNKRKMEKTALVLSGTPARWTSKFASLTFNQYGRELPNGGINEVGLVIEIMWLDGSKYPTSDGRKTINELQWIQYQLDNYKSVKEVIDGSAKLRVTPVAARVHYLACDPTGECAAFEFLGGTLVVSKGKKLKQPVLTNDSYSDSVKHLRKHRGFGGKKPLPTGRSSMDRFVIASQTVKSSTDGNAVEQAFAGLAAVKNGDYSKWNIVYDLKKRRVYFRSHGHRSIKHVDLHRFDTSCKSPVRALDLNTDLKGDVFQNFSDYTDQMNEKLTESTLSKTSGIPPFAKALVARYPRATRCSI